LLLGPVALTVFLPAAGAKPRPGDLRAQQSQLSRQAHTALLDLYSIEAQLTGARRRLAAVEHSQARLEELTRRRRHEVALVTSSAAHAQAQLADHLRALYEQAPPDPIAVVLGAESIDDAISGLDNLERIARQSRSIVSETADTSKRLKLALSHLRRDRAALAAAHASAAAETARLESAAAERRALIARLQRQNALAGAQIAALDAQAQTAADKRITIATPVVASPAPPRSGPPAKGSTMSVLATAYALAGRTATGLPVGHGVAAVDPGFIPLGTRFSVPGYGEAVAADVGSGVRGAMIDLWFPTEKEALDWGTKRVTITFG
jgi:3D (Asp-Asp-Asp) domain-containing protein